LPVNKRHLDMVYSHMRFSDKPYMGSITSEERAEDSIAMSRILFGEAFVDQHCVILGNVNVNSPLLWDGTMTKSARAYARANQAAVIVPFILGGAMGPVTNAGAICAGARRDPGGLRHHPAGASGRAGDLRQLSLQHVAALGLAHLWHARAGDWVHGDWSDWPGA